MDLPHCCKSQTTHWLGLKNALLNHDPLEKSPACSHVYDGTCMKCKQSFFLCLGEQGGHLKTARKKNSEGDSSRPDTDLRREEGDLLTSKLRKRTRDACR